MNKILRILGKRGRITIPYELRQSLGYKYNDLISMTPQSDGSIVIHHGDACTQCADIPKRSPKEILDGFSDEEKKDALLYLSAMWMSSQKENVA